jgi:hypothetical protein
MTVYDPRIWYRDTRGRSFEFYACDEELAQMLADSLPQELAPFSLVATHVEKLGRRQYVHRHVTAGTDRFVELRQEGIRHFNLCSDYITPSLVLPKNQAVSAIVSTNGLVDIQAGFARKGKLEESSIGLVNRIRNKHTDEVVVHAEYELVFHALKSAVRKRLAYTTERVMPDGAVKKSTTLRMTAMFADRCMAGEIVARDRVGRRIK